MQNLSERLADTAARAAEYRTRLELTERAESTLREDLDRERAERREVREELAGERMRREHAEQERDELRREIEALQEASRASETASPFGTPTDRDTTAPEGSQEPVERRS